MSFGYYLKTLPGNGGFSTRAELGAIITQAILDAEVGAENSQTPALCRQIGQSYVTRILDHLKKNDRFLELFIYLRALPVSGGAASTPAGLHDAETIKVGASITLTRAGVNYMRNGTGIEQVGQDDPEVPVFEIIINELNTHQNTWSEGQIVLIRGDHLKFDKNDGALGVWITSGVSGPPIRATTYGNITRGEVQFIVPAGISGPINITMRTRVGTTIRFATYTFPVVQE